MKEKIVITSGYFNPIHKGHLDYLRTARNLGDFHICIVNSDKQSILKKGFSFLPQDDRFDLIKELKCVDAAILSKDEDLTVSKTLQYIFEQRYVGNTIDEKEFIFLNSGDVTQVREKEICDKYGCLVLYVAQSKLNSSTQILKNYEDYLNGI